MSDTLSVPGVGQVPRQGAVIIGGIAAGWVVYAWWHRRAAASAAAPPPEPAQDTTGADRVPPPTVVGSGSTNATGSTTISTNDQWDQAATQYLGNTGWDPKMVASALGKFLGHQPLTEQEADAVRSAIGAFGSPPVGGPWNVTTGSTTPAGPPATPGPTPPGMAGNFWTEVETRPDGSVEHLDHVVTRAFGLRDTDLSNIAVDTLLTREANPQLDFSHPLPLGTPIYIPAIPK